VLTKSGFQKFTKLKEKYNSLEFPFAAKLIQEENIKKNWYPKNSIRDKLKILNLFKEIKCSSFSKELSIILIS